MIDFIQAVVAGSIPLGLAGAVALIAWRSEYVSGKTASAEKFLMVRQELQAHEGRDAERHQQLLDRFTSFEGLMLEVIKQPRK